MDDIEIHSLTESEGEAFDPRTPTHKPSVIKLQKRRDKEKQEAAAANLRRYTRGAKRSVKFSTDKQVITFVNQNLPPFFERNQIRSESPEMENAQPSTSTHQARPETSGQGQLQQQQTQPGENANPQHQANQQSEDGQLMQQMIQQALQQMLPQLRTEIQRMVQQQQPAPVVERPQ